MAAPNVHMRLTVQVLPLAEEDAHGPHRAIALALSKERKFALPVQPEDTFELVWNRIEQRYKRNYLDATQAAAFTIKKLQDAYDCDLDLGDTVSSIFEGEPDKAMHKIKVVPSFINRDFSVPPTSHLRPGHATKRHADFNAEHTSKRRRIEAQQLFNIQEEREPSPNRPIQSTETDHEEQDNTGGAEGTTDLDRSRSGDSLVFVHNAQTGEAEFSAAVIKQEPTDTNLPISNDTPLGQTVAQPLESESQTQVSNRRSQSQETSEQQSTEKAPEAANETAQDTQMSDEPVQDQQQVAASPEADSQEAAIQKSPASSIEQVAATPPPAKRKRKDVYDVPSSPEFMQSKPTPAKSGKTYGRSPRTPKVVQTEVDLLNNARLLSSKAQEKINSARPAPASSKKARSFQLPKPDEIESTPQEAAASKSKQRSQSDSDDENEAEDMTTSFLDKTKGTMPNGTQTPAKNNASKLAKPGSLKKAPMKSLLATPATPASPATAKRGAKREAAKGPSVNTRARKQLEGQNEVATPPTSSKAKLNLAGKDTPSRMQYLQQLLKTSQSTPVSRRSEGSPSTTKKSEEASTPLPANKKQAKEAPKPTEPAEPTEPITETPKPSVPSQSPVLKTTPIRSPVPLPANVAHLVPNATVAAEPSSSKSDAVFKKPALRARSTLNGSPVERRTTRSASADQKSTPLRSELSLPEAAIQAPEFEADTPIRQTSVSSDATRTRIRSEVPLPANVRHLRSSSTPQKQPESSGVPSKTTPTASAEPTVEPTNGVSSPANTTPAKTTPAKKSPAKTTPVAEKLTKPKAAEPTSVSKAIEEDAISISSRESSSTNYSDSLEEQPGPTTNDDVAAETSAPQAGQQGTSVTNGAVPTPDNDADEGYGEEDEQDTTNPPPGAQSIVPDQQDQTTESQPTPWNTQSWGFGSIGQQENVTGNKEENANSEGEPANETERKSSPVSAASSPRSSPAVARQPARFLSHSPTPDASESDDESDEASAIVSKVPSPEPMNENESDSSSSSDSSDDEDVEMPDLPAESTTDSNTNAAPPSSPPINAPKSTPVIPESSQANALPHKTPVPLPSSQAPPHSSQSVSAQAAERRRYTGFRSLREQLAETRAPKAATQTKTFDPRTMSLNKLAKGKPLVAFGGDDDDSSDEESSSSSSDSD